MIHWDGTISLGNILVILALLWPVIKFSVITRDFPPHRHTDGRILYPKGMKPEVIEKENENEN